MDHAVTESLFPKIGSLNKRLVPYEGASDHQQHVIVGDIVSPESTEPVKKLIEDFFKDSVIIQ